VPLWNDGAAKRAITEFVGSVTREESPDYVKHAERIATLDNDGALWCEQSIYFRHGDIKKRFSTAAGGGIAGTPLGTPVGGDFDALVMRTQFAF
jgi:hypothetical protein